MAIIILDQADTPADFNTLNEWVSVHSKGEWIPTRYPFDWGDEPAGTYPVISVQNDDREAPNELKVITTAESLETVKRLDMRAFDADGVAKAPKFYYVLITDLQTIDPSIT